MGWKPWGESLRSLTGSGSLGLREGVTGCGDLGLWRTGERDADLYDDEEELRRRRDLDQDLDLELLQAKTASPDPDTANNPDILEISDLDIVSVEEVSTDDSFDAEDPATWLTIINEDLRQTLVKKRVK